MEMNVDDIARLLSKAVQVGECWEWQGAQSSSGYGNTYVQGKYVNAHTAIFKLFGGVLQAGHYVVHSCDNKLCINIKHLSDGSPAENTKQALDRNRIKRQFTDEQIRQIRGLRAEGVYVKVLAERFGCSKPLIEKIVYGGVYDGVE